MISGTLAFAGAAAAIGYGLEAGGSNLVVYAGDHTNLTNLAVKHIGHATIGLGSGLFYTGKTLAYTILVPAYSIGYVAPKWIVQTGIPKSCEFAREYVVIPAIQSLIDAGKYVAPKIYEAAIFISQYFHKMMHCMHELAVAGAEFLRDYILIPLKEGVISAANYLAPKIYEAAIYIHQYAQMAIHACAELYQMFREYVIAPLTEGLHAAFRFIAPIIYDVAQAALRNIAMGAKYALEVVVKGIEITRDYIIIPLIDSVISTANYLGPKIYEATLFIHHYAHAAFKQAELITEMLTELLIKTGEIARHYIIIPLTESLSSALEYVQTTFWHIAYLAGTYALKALYNLALAAEFTAKHLFNGYCIMREHIFVPLILGVIDAANYIGPKIYEAAVIINDYALQPAFRAIVNIAIPVMNSIVISANYAGNKIADAAQHTANAVIDIASALPAIAKNAYEHVAADVSAIFVRIFAPR